MTKQEFEKLTEVAEKQAIEITQLRKDIDEIFERLIPMVEEIKKTKPFWRIFKYIELVGFLIDEIAQLVEKHGAKQTEN